MNFFATLDGDVEADGITERCHRRLIIPGDDLISAIDLAIERYEREVLPDDRTMADVQNFTLKMERRGGADEPMFPMPELDPELAEGIEAKRNRYVKDVLGCTFGFHRWGEWKWDKDAAEELRKAWPRPVLQHRVCLDCGKVQGVGSSEERRFRESWRDR